MESKEHQFINNSKSTFRQIIICLVANLPTLPGGMALGFSAVATPYMIKDNSTLYLSEHQASLIASCVSLSLPIGSLISGAVMEGFGRKAALLLSCLPAALGWLTIAAFPSFQGVLVGRLLTGFATGFCCHSATVFIAESSTNKLRGILTNGTNLGFSSGVLSVYLLGFLFKEKWRYIAGVCGLVPIIAVFSLLRWMPESPVWLASKGRTNDALKSLAKLRRSHHESTAISSELREMMKNSQDNQEKISLSRMIQSMKRPESYKPLLIMLTFFLFQQISGTFVLIFYGVKFVTEAGVSTDPFVITVLIGLTNVAFTLVVAWASRTFGRRPCAMFSGSGMTFSLTVLIIYLHWTTPKPNLLIDQPENNTQNLTDALKNLTEFVPDNSAQSEYSWIPTMAILFFIMASTLGFLSLPWAMLGEVFPATIRGVACGLCTCVAYIINFFTILAFPPMLEYLGNKGVFTFYAIMSFIATIFVITCLPETQNKSLAQIEDYFAGKRRKGKRLCEEKQSMKR